jgi:hypothetical protein
MKKGFKQLFWVIVIVTGSVITSNAQEVGVRFGGTNGAGGAAIDAVFGSGSGRKHIDVGFYNDGVGVDLLWDFVCKPLKGEDFNWYLGAGPTTLIGDNFWLGICGEAGLEYRFSKLPIAAGVDWRPTFWIIDDTKFGADSFGLNVRWVFGGKKNK